MTFCLAKSHSRSTSEQCCEQAKKEETVKNCILASQEIIFLHNFEFESSWMFPIVVIVVVVVYAIIHDTLGTRCLLMLWMLCNVPVRLFVYVHVSCYTYVCRTNETSSETARRNAMKNSTLAILCKVFCFSCSSLVRVFFSSLFGYLASLLALFQSKFSFQKFSKHFSSVHTLVVCWWWKKKTRRFFLLPFCTEMLNDVSFASP